MTDRRPPLLLQELPPRISFKRYCSGGQNAADGFELFFRERQRYVGAFLVGRKGEGQPMAWSVLASSPARRDCVVAPTRDPHGSRSPFLRFENKNPRAVFRRGTYRLPFWKHAPTPPNLVLPGDQTPNSARSSCIRRAHYRRSSKKRGLVRAAMVRASGKSFSADLWHWRSTPCPLPLRRNSISGWCDSGKAAQS
jgi:hypothetical protein